MKALLSMSERHSVESAGIAQIARIKGLIANGMELDQAIELSGANERVQRVLKANIGAGSTTSQATLLDRDIIVSAFVDILRNSSVFYALLANGMTRLPLRTWAEMLTMDATAWIVGEGAPIPLTTAGFARTYLEPIQAAALTVLTRQLLGGSDAEALMSNALRAAIGTAVDGKFLADIAIDGDTPVNASLGSDAEAAAGDIKALLDDVAPTTQSRLVLAMDPAVQRSASMMVTMAGGFVFPDLTPTGGNIKGIPAIPTAIGAGKVALIDATGFLGDSFDIQVEASEAAALEMKDSGLTQSSTTPTPAQLVSMFQTNSVAIRAVAFFGAARIRDNAVAVVEDVAWGEDVAS